MRGTGSVLCGFRKLPLCQKPCFLKLYEIHTQPVGLLYTNDQPVVQAATFTTKTNRQEKNIHNISGIRTCDFRNYGVPTYASDCMTSGIDRYIFIYDKIFLHLNF